LGSEREKDGIKKKKKKTKHEWMKKQTNNHEYTILGLPYCQRCHKSKFGPSGYGFGGGSGALSSHTYATDVNGKTEFWKTKQTWTIKA